MILRELVGKLGLDFDSRAFDKGEAAFKRLKTVATTVAGLFVASKAAVGLRNMVVNTAELVDRTSDAAEALGISTKALQGRGFAAKILGADQAALQDGLKFVSRAAFAAANGSKETTSAFRRLGVTVKDSNGRLKTADELMLEVSDGMKKIKSPTEAAGLAMQLFGRSGNQLVPFLKAGRARIQELREEVDALGASFDDGLIKESSRLTDNMDRLKVLWQGVQNVIARGLLPRVNALVERFIAWRKRTREIVDTKITQYLDAFVSLAQKLWLILRAGARLVEALGTQFGRLGKELAIAGVILAGLALALGGTNLLILGAATALLLLLEDIYVFVTGGKSAIGELLEMWEKFAKDFGNPDNVDPNEHWLITFLRSVVELTEKARKELVKLFKAPEEVGRDFMDALGFKRTGGAQGAALGAGQAAVPLSNKERSGGMLDALGRYVAEGVFGPPVQAYRAEPSPGAGGNVTMKVEQHISAQPGQDEGAIANMSLKGIRDFFNSEYNDAVSTLAPRLSTP